MPTQMLVIRHGATALNLENPPRLQGRGVDEPLAALGVRQAEQTRETLRRCQLQAIYSSPLRRARQTAEILAAGQGLTVNMHDGFQEGDVGRWENLSWDQIRAQEPQAYQRFMDDPATYGYAGGETFADVAMRVQPVFSELLQRHEGQIIAVVSHQIVCRVYLAGLLGLSPGQARRVRLENCGISVVRMMEGQPVLWSLNSSLHLT